MLEGGGEERDLNWNDCGLISIVLLVSLSLLVFVSITCIFSARDYYLLQNHRRHENQNNGQAAFLDDCPPLDS